VALARDPERSWWHSHIRIKLFLALAHDSMNSRIVIN
jgi:hypothetical protein